MSRSSFSKAYEEITNLEPMEMTFTVEDADLDKLNEVLKDINVKECPWFEVQDKHGNKAKYYREPHWIPCSERLPEEPHGCLVTVWDSTPTGEGDDFEELLPYFVGWDGEQWNDEEGMQCPFEVIAWMPLPEPYREDNNESRTKG